MPYSFSQARLDNPLLADKQYRQALARLPLRPCDEQEHALVVRARAGEQQARELFVVSLLPMVRVFAYRYHAALRSADPRACHWEVLDLVQVGNLVMLEQVERALQAECPFAYLFSCAKLAIRDYCHEYQSLIRLPRSASSEQVCWTESLEQPLSQEREGSYAEVLEQPADVPEPPRNYEALYQAVRRLSPKRQEAVIRVCGLFEQPCEGLAADGTRRAAYHAAVIWLYEQLASCYRQYCSQECESLAARNGSKVAASTLTAQQRERLEQAYNHLQAGGQPVTTEILQAQARITTHAAMLYLRERRQHEPSRHERLTQAYACLQAQGGKITSRRLAQESKVGSTYVSAYLRRLAEQKRTHEQGAN